MKSYTTDDLDLASFLKAKGKNVLKTGLSGTSKKIFSFEFEDYDGCDKLSYSYMNKSEESFLPAKDLFEAKEMFLKMIKSSSK